MSMRLEVGSIYRSEVEARVVADVDVLVAGGGTAGCVAALAAARNGDRVFLVERYGYLGGMLTGNAGLTIFIGYPGGRVRKNKLWFVGNAVEMFASAVKKLQENPSEVRIVGGIPLEITNRLMAAGAGIGIGGQAGTYVTTNLEAFKALLFEMMEEAGVKLLLHSWVVDVIMEKDIIKGVVVENKSGRQVLLGKMIIDATGDADVAAKSGAPFEVGVTPGSMAAKGGMPIGFTEPLGIMYTYGNVDVERVFQFARKNNDWEPTWPSFQGLEDAYQSFRKGQLADIFLPKASAADEIDVEFLTLPVPGFVLTGCGFATQTSGLSAAELTRIEAESKKALMKKLAYLKKNIPGFEKATLANVPQMSVRETRRILGEYVLTIEDLLEAREFKDGIGRGGHPVDVDVSESIREQGWHRPPNWSFSIPYRSLVPQKIKNLLVAGRCISTTHEALGCIRPTAQCMVMGEAAGTAAALCEKNKVRPRDLNIDELRGRLKEQGVIL